MQFLEISWKHIDIKLTAIKKRMNYLMLELNYYTTMLFFFFGKSISNENDENTDTYE